MATADGDLLDRDERVPPAGPEERDEARTSHAPMVHPMRVPARHNQTLATLVARLNEDLEVQQLWKCANVTASDRLGMTDHGPVHIRIVVNIALRLLRLLAEAEVPCGVVQQYGLRGEDAEVVTVLAAALHDIGMSIHRSNHEQFSLVLAAPLVRRLLAGLYDEPVLTIMTSETLHAIIAHRSDVRCLTVEAGCVKVGDALDMAEGRSRVPFEAGRIDMHSLSAAAIDAVSIGRGLTKPIRIEVAMSNSAGMFQLDQLLKPKLASSGIQGYVEVTARIEGETERRLLPVYNL
ncbi:MAG TPA: HD domain-containing protein [Chloroflexota bacterium]|nr:HD domain-containing protein [Chloroflexota bacterium]